MCVMGRGARVMCARVQAAEPAEAAAAKEKLIIINKTSSNHDVQIGFFSL